MKAAFWIWTVFCVVGAGLLIWFLPADQSYSGSNITLTTDDKRQLSINAESVTIEAASGSFFVLRKTSGEAIVGSPTQKPLGWDEDEYYRAEPTQVQGGEWIVEKGSDITIHLSSSGNITVQGALKSGEKALSDILLVVFAFSIWLLGCVLGSKS